jgi:cardiolipin synthase A/B
MTSESPNIELLEN